MLILIFVGMLFFKYNKEQVVYNQIAQELVVKDSDNIEDPESVIFVGAKSDETKYNDVEKKEKSVVEVHKTSNSLAFKNDKIRMKKGTSEIEERYSKSEEIFDVVEHIPSYPGGQAALFKYLSSNIEYPSIAEENGVQGKVYVKFCVEKDGYVREVKLLKSLEPSCDAEAVRVVKSMPKWIPGKHNGKIVRVWYTLPIVFKLD